MPIVLDFAKSGGIFVSIINHKTQIISQYTQGVVFQMDWGKSLTILLFLLPLSVFSKRLHTASLPVFSSGWYAGVSAGGMISQYKINTTSSTQYPSSAFFSQSQSNPNLFGSTPQGSIFLGYLYALNTKFVSLYIGPEIYGSISNPAFSTNQSAEATLPTESFNTQINGNSNAEEGDIDLRIGKAVTAGSLLFGRIGAAFNTITINASSTIARPALPLTSTVNNNYSKFITGLRLGGGVEQTISQKYHIRVDYIFTYYPSMNSSATQQSNPAATFQLAPISNTTFMQLNTNTFLFSIIYQGGRLF